MSSQRRRRLQAHCIMTLLCCRSSSLCVVVVVVVVVVLVDGHSHLSRTVFPHIRRITAISCYVEPRSLSVSIAN